MALFQTTVVQKYINAQDKNVLKRQWETYKTHFHNPSIQENIRNAKEEQYQEGFLRDLFVNVLGYTLNPETNFNLTTELKNVKDAKKADGGILVNDKVVGVIELKGTDTTDLSKVETQAFGYKNNQKNCTYVITSNFEKLRFYIDNAIEHQAFDLFQLTEKDFKLLYLCLAYENISKDIPKKLKNESLSQEDVITKQLYKDYSLFKRELFNNLTELNPDTEPLLLFKKSQKLLDRFLFLFFAEDRHLLPPNSVRLVLKQWKQLKELDAYSPLYSRYKKYFGYLNTGHKGKKYDVYPYNGGLFKPDDILDQIEIDDDLLYKHTLKLSEYDFDSEVDVNILGHIFENSLNEIEEIQTQLEEDPNAKPKVSKRKKDGVFYTPKYITKYIVENTVGKLCEEQKELFKIVEEEFTFKRQKKTKETLLEKLKTYRQWLLELTICDPACGSGAFLNEALNYLIAEHQYIDELETKLMGGGFVFPNVENSILENNLFGVDINNESVEIAKLSLWLRTAQPNRKLNDLSHNIKCGNSLIDDPEVAGDKAFDWKTEFPKVFAKGGFDVVIGNPPYVNANQLKRSLSKIEYDYLKRNYKTAKGTVDLYIYFFERGLKVINNNGILCYITPNRFLSASYGKALREFIVKNYKIDKLIDYSDKKVFPDASTYPVISFFTFKTNSVYDITTGKFNNETKELISKKISSEKLNILDDYILGFLLNDKLKITERIFSQAVSLQDCGKINATSTAKEADEYSELINESNGLKLINTGTIDPYKTEWGFDYLTDKGQKYKTPYLPNGNSKISKNRYSLYNSNKIIIAKIGLRCEAFYDEKGDYASVNTNCIHSFSEQFLPEYILCWVNSKLYNYIFECLFDGLRMSGGYLLFSAPNLKSTFIKQIEIKQQEIFIRRAKDMLSLNKDLQLVSSKFHRSIQREFPVELEKLPRKLQNWYELSFADFVKELKKKKIKLSLSQKAEWEDYFLAEQQKALDLQGQINATDKEIDQMVYELYGLTEEEIEVVENS